MRSKSYHISTNQCVPFEAVNVKINTEKPDNKKRGTVHILGTESRGLSSRAGVARVLR